MQKPDTSPLYDLMLQASRKAQSTGREILVSHAQTVGAVDPIELFASVQEVTSDRWYWEHPNDNRSIVSLGTLTGSTPPRNIRFQEVNQIFWHYASGATFVDDSQSGSAQPIFHIAFSFDPWVQQDRLVWQGFPSTFLLVPRMTLIREGDDHTLLINTLVTAGTDIDALQSGIDEFLDEIVTATDPTAASDLIVNIRPPDETNEKEIRAFTNAVNRAEAAIRDEEVEVMTVARRREVTTGERFRLRKILLYLRKRYPHSRLVASGRNTSTFIGLAPDLLVSLRGKQIQASCLVGSIRRGDTPELDTALASQLAEHPDKLEHHELTVAHILDALDDCCDDVEAPDEPSIGSTTERHYLVSTMTGTLDESFTLFDVIGAMHPLVETCGEPVDTARRLLQQHENLDRGWFSAPYGWVDLNGGGEFIATTQAAVIPAPVPVIEQQRAYLFTLSPVHSGSDPEDDLTETDESLNALQEALTQ